MFASAARWVPGLGIVFALLVAAATFVKSAPGTDASDEAWTAYYADSANRREEEVAFLLIGLAALCFLQFLGSLRGALARAEGEPAPMTTAAVASGAAFITIAVAGHAVGTAVAWTAGAFDDFTVDPDTARLLAGVSYKLYVMSLFAAAGMALAAATIALWLRGLPAWLGGLSVLATIAGVLGIVTGLTGLVVLAWIVVLSAYLVWPRAEPTAKPPPA